MVDQYQKQGYDILRHLCTSPQVKELRASIQEAICLCCEELNISEEEYLSVATRWVDPSPLTRKIVPYLVPQIKRFLEEYFGCKVVNKKMNVICKTKYSAGAVPCHQDIAYSPDDPYEFTVWMPVNDVSVESGVLQILPKSHLDPIEPAVDFWQVDFVDSMRESERWQSDHLSFPLEAGDAVLFDSRIWHGSAPSLLPSDRFAIVSRWSREGWVNRTRIPQKRESFFGMWTAGSVTEEKLKSFVAAELSYNQLVERAIEILEVDGFGGDVDKAIESLKDLRTLNDAAEKHNGGDAQGVIYKHVWNSFLRCLD